MKKIYKVYTHTCPDGMIYVGVTCQELNRRWQPANYQNISLEPYINKFGWDNIIHQVIYSTPDKEEAYSVEEEMICYYREKGCCINQKHSGLSTVIDPKKYDIEWKNKHQSEISTKKHQKYQDDEEFREKCKEISRKQYNKKKNDPEFKRKRNERARELYWIKKKQSQDNLGIAY